VNILDTIIAHKRVEVAALRQAIVRGDEGHALDGNRFVRQSLSDIESD